MLKRNKRWLIESEKRLIQIDLYGRIVKNDHMWFHTWVGSVVNSYTLALSLTSSAANMLRYSNVKSFSVLKKTMTRACVEYPLCGDIYIFLNHEDIG